MLAPKDSRATDVAAQRGLRGATADRTTMARTLAYLLGAGAVLTILSIVVRSSVSTPDVGIAAPIAAVVAVTALAMAVALRIRGATVFLRAWRFQLLLAGATTLVTAAVWMDGPSSAFAIFYVLIALYAAYFFTRLQTFVQVVFASASYAAAVLAQDPSPADLARWLTTVGVLAVACVLVFATQGRLAGVISRLEAAPRTDAPTGLLNPRGVEETIETEVERAKRSGGELSLIVGDLDHFKALNDLRGHGAGDDALEAVASVMGAARRRIDSVARIGGEEFAVLVPESDEHEAYM